ncbi:MAG: sugar transferase [Planctomycetes bacterium]|nr:sugar transferase [Planctomycetota bacterium]
MVRRLFDILITLVALTVLSPLLIPIMVILRFTGEHEVFYLQDRVGYRNQTFKIWKFATMLKNSPIIGTGSLTLRNDPRVLPVGKFLRMTKINELPQLFNVLIGDMSIVGPRPQMDVDFKAYPKHVQDTIYNVTPGMTGIGSIVFRDEEEIMSKCPLSPHECYARIIALYKGELEMWYMKNRSPRVDALIVFLTVWVILFSRSELHYRVFTDLPAKPESFSYVF